MVEDNKAPENGPPKDTSGIFGPLINLVNQARSVHPAAGYLLVILALFAVGAAIFKMADPISAQVGLLRAVLFIALLLLFLLLLIAFVADYILPSEKPIRDLQLRRGVLLLVTGLIGGFATWQVSNATPANCKFRNFLLGAMPEDCIARPEKKEVVNIPPEDDIPPPATQPEPPKKVIFGGYVNNRKIAEAAIDNLKIRVRFATTFVEALATPDNIFTVELPREAIDETVFVSMKADGFKPITGQAAKIVAPDKGTENINNIWELFPVDKPPTPTFPGKAVFIPMETQKKLQRKAILMQKK